MGMSACIATREDSCRLCRLNLPHDTISTLPKLLCHCISLVDDKVLVEDLKDLSPLEICHDVRMRGVFEFVRGSNAKLPLQTYDPICELAIQAQKNMRWNVEICAKERMMRMMKRRSWATVGFSDERTMLTPVKDWRNFDFMNKEKNRRTRG
jgi:hypothetical protein